MKSAQWLVVGLLLIAGCQFIQPAIRGSGNTKSESREIGSFDRVRISGSAEFELLAGQAAPTCEVEFDDNLLPLVSTQVIDGELQVSFTKSVSSRKPLRLRLATEHLKQLTISGSAKGVIENIKEPALACEVSGSGEIRCSGTTAMLTLDTSGSGKFDCEELIANDVKIKVSGSGNAIVHAVDSLAVDISGSGRVQYLGDPEINKQISGSGTIEPLAVSAQ